jgi:phosphotransferase system IIB component
MRRREPHAIHFQEFENLKRDCILCLGNSDIANCIKRLDFYLKQHSDDEKSNSLLNLMGRNTKNEQDYIKDIINRDEYNKERNRIQEGLKLLLDTCMPPDYDEYQQTSLRRKSKWDERDNLTIFLQFDRDFRFLGNLFTSFETDWQPHIHIEKYVIDENDKEIIVPEDSIEENQLIGIEEGKTVMFPEDFGSGQEASINEQIDTQPEIKIKPLQEVGTSLRIKKQYPKAVLKIDEYGKDEIVLVQETALAIVEKSETGFIISVSVVGANDAKCNLANDILQWFENHEFILNGRYEPFTICIPQAKSFMTSHGSNSEVLISLIQPV